MNLGAINPLKSELERPAAQGESRGTECIVCGCDSSKTVFHIPPKRIVECTRCGHEYVNQIPTKRNKTCFFPDDDSDKLATEIDVHFLCMVLERQALLNCKLLDLGCGRGRIAAALVENGWEPQNLYLLDQSAHDLEIARRACPGATLIEADIEQDFLLTGAFDCILMFEFLEHMPDPRKALQDAASVLRPGGLLIVRALPNNSSFEAFVAQGMWKMRRYEEHYHFFNLKTFSALVESLENMEILEVGTFLQEGFRFYHSVRIAKNLGIISRVLNDNSCLSCTGQIIQKSVLGDLILEKLRSINSNTYPHIHKLSLNQLYSLSTSTDIEEFFDTIHLDCNLAPDFSLVMRKIK